MEDKKPVDRMGLLVLRIQFRGASGGGPAYAAAVLVADDLRDAEVDQLDHRRLVLALNEEDVRRLEITVNDPCCMRLLERACGLEDHAARGLGIETPGAREQAAEIFAPQELHGHEQTELGIV